VVLDTCFLIDLFREARDVRSGPASRLLEQHGRMRFHLPPPVWMEFAAGFRDDQRELCARFLAPFVLVALDADICWRAARLDRSLRAAGRPIGDHDLWIAACALVLQSPLITRNRRHFERIPGLALVGY
jgi:tRNA(fMet)-specific endonuclease VapC